MKNVRTVTVDIGCGTWPLRLERTGSDTYEITARATQFTVHMKPLADGNYLISIPEFKRCGSVPSDPSSRDIQEYCGIENKVDAVNVAVAAQIIIGGPQRG